MARSGTRIHGKLGRILIAIVAAILICGLGLIVISHMILNEKTPESGAGVSVAVLLFCAVFIGGQALLKIEERKLMYPIIVGAIVVAMMVLGGFLMEGEFQNVLRNLISVSAGCVFSALIFLKRSGKKKVRKIGHR